MSFEFLDNCFPLIRLFMKNDRLQVKFPEKSCYSLLCTFISPMNHEYTARCSDLASTRFWFSGRQRYRVRNPFLKKLFERFQFEDSAFDAVLVAFVNPWQGIWAAAHDQRQGIK